MKLRSSITGFVGAFPAIVTAISTWPSVIDELEDVMFLNTGYKNRGFSSHITPCSFSEFGLGRQTAAEWLRIGFHDMATTNVFFEPHGGIDASLALELQSGENIGKGFNTTLTTYAGLYNSRLSVADLIALGVYASVRGCGGPIVPMRGGRIDATIAGPIGVPLPQNGQGIFINQFARMGFNTVDMIQMTACGHAIGGVHAGDFPEVVAPGTAPNDYQLFDTTPEFDNKLAIQYINGPSSDPLSVGISVKNTRNSDFAVFTADKNVTIRSMQTVATFNTICSSILQRMIETVPPAVSLSDVIVPYEVKPSGVQLTLLAGGNQIKFAGDIRIRTTSRKVSSVSIIYKSRSGATGGTLTTTLAGTANGFDDSFAFYSFNAKIPALSSISSFTVTVAETGGLTTTFSNNGTGFRVQDSVMVLLPQTCFSKGKLQVTAAVRSTATAPGLTLTQKVARAAGTPVPVLSNSTAAMTKAATIGSYDIYTGTIVVSPGTGAKFGVSSGAFADDFKDVSALGGTCAPFDTTSSSSIPSSGISSSTAISLTTSSTLRSTSVVKSSNSLSNSPSTSSTSTANSISRSSISTISTGTSTTRTQTSLSGSATATPSRKSSVGSYAYQGCWMEGSGARALTGKVTYGYSSMTLEICASSCTGYTYFGVEYGGECYCGDVLAISSIVAAQSDCSFSCPGDATEYCGAGSRLELYKLASSSSSTPSQSILPSSGPYNYMGCYTEPSSVRALPEAFYPDDAQTIELCVQKCGTKPYKYAGAEYGRECWCADTLSGGSNVVRDEECGMSCVGDVLEYCGSANRLSVYIRNGTVT